MRTQSLACTVTGVRPGSPRWESEEVESADLELRRQGLAVGAYGSAGSPAVLAISIPASRVPSPVLRRQRSTEARLTHGLVTGRANISGVMCTPRAPRAPYIRPVRAVDGANVYNLRLNRCSL